MDEENKGCNNFQESAPKRMKNTHKNDDPQVSPDRLSELPEELLVKILSLLPMEDSVRTGLLSTRWINLWNHVDKIVFDFHSSDRSPQSIADFLDFVDNTLIQCSCPEIKKFLFTAHFFAEDNARKMLDKWLQWVYSRKVQFLTVDVNRFDRATPEWFFRNSSLVKLDVSDLTITILGPVVSWTSLKSLSLSYLAIGDEEIEKILSGCPVLENLALYEVTTLSRLNIVSSSLLQLSAINSEYYAVYSLEINAPRLQNLVISGYFVRPIRLTSVSSLVHANLDLRRSIQDDHNMSPDEATNLLQSVHHVEKITFGPQLIQALSMLKLSGKPCPLFKCKHLTVHSAILKYDLPGITYLLQNSPHLETLVIEVENYEEYEFHQHLNGICDFDGAVFLNEQSGNFLHLKKIEVAYHGCYCSPRIRNEGYFDFELVAYIARKARVLHELVFISSISIEELCWYCSGDCASQHASKLHHDLSQVGKWKLTRKKSDFEI